MNLTLVNKQILGKYQDMGFSLEEDEDILTLTFKGQLVGRFSVLGALQLSIQERCQEWLDNLEGRN
jgi:hypothetical protein